MMNNFKDKFVGRLKNLIYPRDIKCIFCGEELNQNAINECCAVCLSALPFITSACARCGNPILDDESGICFDCTKNNYEFVSAKSIFIYRDSVAQLIHRIKYNGELSLIPSISKFLIGELNKSNLFPDYITNVPMFKAKEKERGFNQSSLICKEISNTTQIPFIELCEKIKETPSQASLSFKERKQNLIGAFAVKPECKNLVKNKTILVVDDVFTTGSTTNEICTMLERAKAKACYVLTIAHSVVQEDEKV